MFEYFYVLQEQVDLGDEESTVATIVNKLFLDLLDRTEDMHKIGLGLRDLHDDNVLVIRYDYNKFKLRLIDFGLNAVLDQPESIEQYDKMKLKNSFRDPSITDENYHKQVY